MASPPHLKKASDAVPGRPIHRYGGAPKPAGRQSGVRSDWSVFMHNAAGAYLKGHYPRRSSRQNWRCNSLRVFIRRILGIRQTGVTFSIAQQTSRTSDHE